MNEQLRLENVRNVLARLEETIIFGLIERAQYCSNSIVYEAEKLDAGQERLSIVRYLLKATEKIHAHVRRYTSPDEHPFFSDLPPPILPALRYDENPLRPTAVNINDRLLAAYEREIVPYICREGDDGQYGSSAVCDVNCLQALSKRVHYGKFVAESKYRADPARFQPLIDARDTNALRVCITDTSMEKQVLSRVRRKARMYAADLNSTEGVHSLDPECVVAIYERWVIPLNKDVQVSYLQERT